MRGKDRLNLGEGCDPLLNSRGDHGGHGGWRCGLGGFFGSLIVAVEVSEACGCRQYDDEQKAEDHSPDQTLAGFGIAVRCRCRLDFNVTVVGVVRVAVVGQHAALVLGRWIVEGLDGGAVGFRHGEICARGLSWYVLDWEAESFLVFEVRRTVTLCVYKRGTGGVR